jgi:hypothetical protein
MGESEIRRLDIERYAAGELTGIAKAQLEEHLRECASCKGYLVELHGEQKAFLGEHPFGSLRWLAERPRLEPWFGRFMGAFALPSLRPVLIPLCLFMFVAALLLPFIGTVKRENGRPDAGIGYKGKPTLSYIYKRNDTVHEALPSDTFFAGDAIQIFYASKTDQYVSLFSIDSRGGISFYQPDEHSSLCSIRTGAGSKVAYPKSIQLDGTPGGELVVALLTAVPMTTMQVEGWIAGLTAASGGDLNQLEKGIRAKPLGEQSTVLTLLLRKR